MAILDLKRVKEYIELGFEKEEALEMVRKEAEEAPEKPADTSSEEIKQLKDKVAELEAEKEKEKDTFKEDPKEDPMDIKDAFKNLFA